MQSLKLVSLIAILNLTGVVFGAEDNEEVYHIDQKILERLRSNDASITSLDLWLERIGDERAIVLADILSNNTNVTYLNLADNDIGEAGAIAIADALRVNTSLTILLLTENKIGKAGAQALAEALKVNPTLRALYLGKNQIGEAGAQALAEALRENTSLTELYLGSNQIRETGAQALAESLRENTTLRELCPGSNLDIGDVLFQEIRRLISPEGIKERIRFNTFWYPSSELALTGNRATHVTIDAWGLAPQLHSFVLTVFLCGVRVCFLYDGVGIDGVIALPSLPNEIWIEILKCLSCSNFGPRALPAT